jgi:hypothetical protein
MCVGEFRSIGVYIRRFSFHFQGVSSCVGHVYAAVGLDTNDCVNPPALLGNNKISSHLREVRCHYYKLKYQLPQGISPSVQAELTKDISKKCP